MTVAQLIAKLQKAIKESGSSTDVPVYYGINPLAENAADREKFVLEDVRVIDGMLCITSGDVI